MSELSEPVAAPPTRRVPFIVLAVVCVLAVLAVGGFLLFDGPDQHTQAACAAVRDNVSAATLEDGVVAEVKAISEAANSEDPGLRRAANVTSVTSEVPTDSPLYQNPGDVKFNAVAAWCKAHG